MSEIKIHILDVGQGDCTIIQAEGLNILVDCGSSKNADLALENVKEYFNTIFNGGAYHFDYLFLTHPDSDHYNLLNALLEADLITFDQVYVSGVLTDYYGGQTVHCKVKRCVGAHRLKRIVEYKKQSRRTGKGSRSRGSIGPVFKCFPRPYSPHSRTVKTEYSIKEPSKFDFWLYEGMENAQGNFHQFPSDYKETNFISKGEFKIDVLAANVSGYFSSSNTKSLVLRVYNNNVSAILAGDATYLTEAFMLAQHNANVLETNVLKVGHHGSAKTSTSGEWAEATDPQYAFISSDRLGDTSGVGRGAFQIPSQAVIDTILNFGRNNRLSSLVGNNHYFVSCFDSKYSLVSRSLNSFNSQASSSTHYNLDEDYKHAFDPNDQLTDTSQYMSVATTKGVFTTLYLLDHGMLEEDLGTSYEIKLSSNGAIDITTSSDMVTPP
ncbi:hypothetical protein BFP97_00750 [Roseivirga sp. 4D4]|uniref:ComEC/Rec2 family competence protein n=1 Tax=Roseivirga sp. 4D4 TaxID=1889784 RepID=UPI000852C992|nr:MBL fold metallo-hydrolase [Roseivirga sp. 4D4]OEK00131.1 hypothetical protein BFP97_00750 [Roseivirga sp. 4D4]